MLWGRDAVARLRGRRRTLLEELLLLPSLILAGVGGLALSSLTLSILGLSGL